MATLPSPDPERYGKLHVLRRRREGAKPADETTLMSIPNTTPRRPFVFPLILLAFLGGLALGGNFAPQRYQIVNGSNRTFLLDTVRGEVWSWDYTTNSWVRNPVTGAETIAS